MFKGRVESLQKEEGKELIRKVRALTKLAEEGKCTFPRLLYLLSFILYAHVPSMCRTPNNRHGPRTRVGRAQPEHVDRYPRRVVEGAVA